MRRILMIAVAAVLFFVAINVLGDSTRSPLLSSGRAQSGEGESSAKPAKPAKREASRKPAAKSRSCQAWQEQTAAKLRKRLEAVANVTVVKAGVAHGAAIAVGCRDKVVTVAVGHTGDGQPVKADSTLFDLASVNKTFTAVAILKLAEEGRIKLDDPVGRWLPEYASGAKAKVTFRMLLQHRSGLVDQKYKIILAGVSTPEQARKRILAYSLSNQPGANFSYSNVGYAVLWEAGSKAAGQQLDEYLRAKFFKPLGMDNTRYKPPSSAPCAPTSPDADQRQTLKCTPQDRLARALGGVTGLAGLFSTASDMGKFAGMLANQGSYGGKSYLTKEHVALLGKVQKGNSYGLGAWTNRQRDDGTRPYSNRMSTAAFGHYGWNVTSMFVDPQSGRYAVLLTNGSFRRQVSDADPHGHAAVKAVNDAAARAD